MAQEDKKLNMKEKDSLMTKISLVSLLIVLLFIIEIYEIINDPGNLIAIGIIGIFILAAVYVETVLIHSMMVKKAEEQEEAYNNVYRSEKASYLLIRKYFDQIEQRMNAIERKSGLPIKELVTAQKALAKVQISRSKENAEALMNSNDRMLESIINFQKALENTVSDTDKQKDAFSEGSKDILEKQQEILSYLKELELTLKNEIAESASKVASMQVQVPVQEIPTPQPEPVDDFADNAVIKEELPAAEPEVIQESEQPALEDDIDNFEVNTLDISDIASEGSSESDLDKMLQDLESGISSQLEPISDEPQLSEIESEIPELSSIGEFGESELPPMEELNEPETPVMDEIAEMLPSMDEIAELDLPPMDEIAESEIPVIDEIAEPEIPELSSIEEIAEPEIPELSSIEEPAGLDVPAMESFTESDLPSMDEIEAMMPPVDEISEPEIPSMDEFAELELPAMEETPQVPEMSDPGHKMTPDEIAALVAGNSAANDIPAEPEPVSIPEPELSALSDLDISEPKMSVDDIAALVAESGIADEDLKLDTILDEPVEELIEELPIEELPLEPLEDTAPIEEAEPAMPDLSDPGHVMSPDEIAALIANADTFEEPPKEEAKPAMPDLSDPGHVMSPDEIAALLANM